MTPKYWLVARFPILPQSADAASYYLFERGATGCEEKDGAFFAYFADQDAEQLRAQLQADAQKIIDSGLALPAEPISIARIPEQDWHRAWRRFFKPVIIGEKIVVRPPWEQTEVPAGAVEIVLEPKQAFGTGTHATTKLMLQQIAAHAGHLPDCALDVGTGSGILAIAHALLNPRARLSGCDLDAIAIENAIENAQINGVQKQIDFWVGGIEVLQKKAAFACIYANLQRHIILPILPQLSRLLAENGLLLISGLLDSEEQVMHEALADHQLEIQTVSTLEEWIAIAASKTARE